MISQTCQLINQTNLISWHQTWQIWNQSLMEIYKFKIRAWNLDSITSKELWLLKWAKSYKIQKYKKLTSMISDWLGSRQVFWQDLLAASTYNRFAADLQRRPRFVNRRLSNVQLLIETPHRAPQSLDHNVDELFLMKLPSWKWARVAPKVLVEAETIPRWKSQHLKTFSHFLIPGHPVSQQSPQILVPTLGSAWELGSLARLNYYFC